MDTSIGSIFLVIDVAILIICFALFIRLVAVRRSRKSKTIRKRLFVQEVESKINKYLISTSENEGLRLESVHQYQVKDLRKLIRSNAAKDQLMKRLLQLKSELNGEFDVLLKELYESLDLEERSKAKLKSLLISHRIEGVSEISEFDQSNSYSYIKKMLRSTFLPMRQIAQLAMVKLTPRGDDPLTFITSHWSELTYWHQLQLHLQLCHATSATQITSKHAVQFEKLLRHDSITVKVFALKLCILFQKVEHLSLIRELLYSECIQIRLWSLKAISKMGDDTDVAVVTNILQTTDDSQEREACLRALSQIGGDTELDLLKRYCRSKIKSHRLMAVYAIEQITFNAREFITSSFAGPLPKELRRTIEHIEEPLNSIA